MKKLEEMTLEELWQLFPVVLKEYSPDYVLWYEEERKNIEKRIGKENIFRIRHIGSTSVPGLLCKPTVDILLELVPEAEQEKIIASLKEEWILMSESESPKKFVFNKGYTPAGFAERSFICTCGVREIGMSYISAIIFGNIPLPRRNTGL